LKKICCHHFLIFYNQTHITIQQQAALFHLSNLTPRLNKVCLKRDKENHKSKQNADAIVGNSLEKLRNSLVTALKTEFSESAKLRRDFQFNIEFLKPLENVSIRTWSSWSSSKMFVSSGSFNIDRAISPVIENSKHYFSHGGLTRVQNIEIR
jgi:hypothetical protein